MSLYQTKIIETARILFGSFVKDIHVIKDDMGHPCMFLFFNHNHKLLIQQIFPWERLAEGQWPHQKYCVDVMTPDKKIISRKQFLTAKMVKMAILKTKKLDILKGANYGI